MPSGKQNSSPTKLCEQCNTVFVYKLSVEKRGHARFCSKECQRQWQSTSKRGIKPYEMTAPTREKIRLAKLGVPNPSKGSPRPQIQGENNYGWKGSEVSYRSLHKWVARKLGQPEACNDCGATGLKGRKIHWSNISRQYLRNLDDWQRLCAKCHKAYDMKIIMARTRG